MYGAPPGFIPIKDGVIINVKEISSVSVFEYENLTTYEVQAYVTYVRPFKNIGVDFDKPIVSIGMSDKSKWYINKSLPQFIVIMFAAFEELKNV